MTQPLIAGMTRSEYIQRPDQKQKRKAYQQAMKHKQPEYAKRWKNKNPLSYLLVIAKSRAKRKNLDFDLKIEDLILPTHCPILGIPLQINSGSGAGGKDNSYSLDRIDQSKGYIKGNVQIISHKANSMKFTASKEELLKFAAWIYGEYLND